MSISTTLILNSEKIIGKSYFPKKLFAKNVYQTIIEVGKLPVLYTLMLHTTFNELIRNQHTILSFFDT